MKELICIVCPKGCHLRVDEADNYRVEGNGCARGEVYGREELTNPTRTITSTSFASARYCSCCWISALHRNNFGAKLCTATHRFNSSYCCGVGDVGWLHYA